jgi:streptogramin lyase
MRRLLTVSTLSSALVAIGCAGDTDPATNVTHVGAQLNAHGRTTGEPATWWWEYATSQAQLGTANDIEVCGAGDGPKEPDNRCGPASWENRGDINLNVVATGLAPTTTYYFRACGKKQSWSQGACGAVKSFTTLAGTSYVFDRKWGTPGTGNSQFGLPSDTATDTSGNVYVVDESGGAHDRVQKFSSTGAFITKWGSSGQANGQFRNPTGIATGPAGTVYVADISNERIQKFTASGAFVTAWGAAGAGDGQFSGPRSVATDPSGNVYVADTGNNRIQKFTSTGSFVTAWGTFGPNPGQFQTPRSLATDSAGNVYVADSGNARVQKFTSAGMFLSAFSVGVPGVNDPYGIATDATGSVYVADTFSHRILKFTSTGSPVTDFGSSGADDGELAFPRGLDSDPAGYVYVADWGNARVQRFRPDE